MRRSDPFKRPPTDADVRRALDKLLAAIALVGVVMMLAWALGLL